MKERKNLFIFFTPYKVLWILPVFLGLLDPDPDPLVRGVDPDPSIIRLK
jgi:hypothetical protein